MKIAVYCSAKNSISEEYLQLGDVLGEWIASHGHTLVYGGATGGLMSRTSNAARKAGGYVIGVVPDRICRAGRKADNCDETILVAHMNERKQVMKERSDCFVCLPGSYGTLDEMFDVIAAGTIGEHRKPIFIVNYKDFYRGLQEETAHMRQEAFLPQEESYAPVYVSTLEELFEQLSAISKA